MDTTAQQQTGAADVQARLDAIRQHMPNTYRAIQQKAAEVGPAAYRFVRNGVAGVPNRFYAIEGGRVAGTPFDLANVPDELARLALQFGISFLIMWAPEAQQLPRVGVQGDEHGAH